MPRSAPLRRVLVGVALGATVLAGCGDSDEDPEAATTSAPADTTAAAVADAEAKLRAQGFSAEGASCMVDSLLSSGIDPEDLEDVDSADADQEILDAAGQAGMECASEIADDIPPGAIDLEDPVVREQFVRTFAQTTGLSTEAAECVAQYFLDNDVDYVALVAAAGGAEPDPETAAKVNAAIESCA